jgi:3-dehydroquinate dehydratase/shikimate dehydrogenase
MICVPIVAGTNEAARADLKRAAAVADLAELRLDYLQEPPDLAYLLDGRPCPVIVTNRSTRQGGLSAASDVERVAPLREAVYLGAEYVDVEHDAIGLLRERLGTRVIVSYHNFEETPVDLHRIAQNLLGTGGDIIKIATYVRDVADNVRLCQLASDIGVPKIIIGMGEKGIPTRVLAVKFGSYLTYAPLARDRSSAPGQVTADELVRIYHFRSINADTRVFGVVGKPLGHSLSPHVQNAALRHAGLNGVYVPFEVDDFAQFLKCCRCINPEGFSVTIPHKEEALRLADETDEVTRKIGAVNTLAFRGGRLVGTNTDWRAAIGAIKSAMPQGESLAGRQALVLGAGGAARAIVFGLASEGAAITITSRTLQRAETLAREAGCRAVPWDERTCVSADVVANSTPLGMYPAIDATPLPKTAFKAGAVVFDAVYNPRVTRLLEEAAAADCKAVEGLEMFVHQAAAQFEFWTGIKVPKEVFREAAIAALDNIRETE